MHEGIRIDLACSPGKPKKFPFNQAGIYSIWDPNVVSGVTRVNPSVDDHITRIVDPIQGKDITCATPAWRPIWTSNVLDGQAGIFYDLSANLSLFTASANIVVGAWTTILVIKLTSVVACFTSTMLYNGADGSWLYNATSGPSMRSGIAGAFSEKNTPTTILPDTNPHTVFNVHGGTHATHLAYRDNVVLTTTDGANVNDPGTTPLAHQFFLGSSSGIASPVRGYILYAAIVDHALNSTERSNWQTYLKARFPSLP
jgi:hypothetical protein